MKCKDCQSKAVCEKEGVEWLPKDKCGADEPISVSVEPTSCGCPPVPTKEEPCYHTIRVNGRCATCKSLCQCHKPEPDYLLPQEMKLRVSITYRDDKTEVFHSTDFPSVGSDWITMYDGFDRTSIPAQGVKRIEQRFVKNRKD